MFDRGHILLRPGRLDSDKGIPEVAQKDGFIKGRIGRGNLFEDAFVFFRTGSLSLGSLQEFPDELAERCAGAIHQEHDSNGSEFLKNLSAPAAVASPAPAAVASPAPAAVASPAPAAVAAPAPCAAPDFNRVTKSQYDQKQRGNSPGHCFLGQRRSRRQRVVTG